MLDMFSRKLVLLTDSTDQTWSVLLSVIISGLDTVILCLGEILHLLEFQRRKMSIYSFFTYSKVKEKLFIFLLN